MSAHQDNGTANKFTVEISGYIKTQIKELAKQAASIGQKQQYLQAWLDIEKRLEGAPVEFGECHYHLAKGKLRCHVGVIRPVAVEFAIHEEKHKVILLKVALLGI